MRREIKRALCGAVGTAVSVIPTALAVISYFPMWVAEGGESILSGFTALLLILTAVPLFRLIRRLLHSPSAWMMWLVAFLLFFLLSRIADEMTVISFVGLVSNIVGALIYRIGGKTNTQEQ